MTPIQASLKKTKDMFTKIYNLLHERKNIKPKFQVNNLVRTADSERSFSKGDTTNWSYNLYKITEVFNDTIPGYENR